MIRSAHWLCCLVLAVGLVVCSAAKHPALAANATCTFSGPSLNFGTTNPYSGYPYTASGNIGISCTNPNASSVTVYGCISIGTGSGGTTAANRTIAHGTDKVGVQINGGSYWPAQIGNGTSYPMAGPFSSPVAANSSFSGAFPLVATMPNPGSGPPPGSYTSSFTGADAQVYYITAGSSPGTCSALMAASPSVGQANFSINATIATQCTVAATSLTFPTSSVLSAPVTASAAVNVTCNTSVPVTIALDNGATGTGPTARVMKSGSKTLTYGIYRDSPMTQPWGSTAGTNTASLANGTGSLTAYGQVPAQSSPAPGAYSDVVNVTISY